MTLRPQLLVTGALLRCRTPQLQPQARPVNSTTTFLSNAGKRNALPHGPNRTSITVRQVDGVPLHSLSLAYREYVPRSIAQVRPH